MALPRTQTELANKSPGILHPEVGAGQIARDFAPRRLVLDKSPRDFAPRRLVLDKSPGILRPEVGAGQNVPEFCKAGIRLNKIMGKTVMGQKRSQKCKDIKLTWQYRLVSIHLS